MMGLGAMMLVQAAGGATVTNENPYRLIYERNVFGLRPPPPSKPPLPVVSPPKITLTGITTIFGDKRALLTVHLPARPPTAARQEPLILKEGEQEKGVEVVDIDETAGKVTVNNSGKFAELTFKKNGVPPPQALSPVAIRPKPVAGTVSPTSPTPSPRIIRPTNRYRAR